MARVVNLAIAAIALIAPDIASANAGIPMLALAWPAQWLAFIPIVLVECELIRRPLQLPFHSVIWPVIRANFISTLVGVPIAWLAMLAPLMVVGVGLSSLLASTNIPDYVQYIVFPFTAAWIGGSGPWEVYFAFTVLTIPFCIVSVFLEEGSIRKTLPDIDRSMLHRLVVRANVWSYVLLSILALAVPLMGGWNEI